MTKVISLFGGPGSGKSTLAAELFVKYKNAGVNVELVRKYVKDSPIILGPFYENHYKDTQLAEPVVNVSLSYLQENNEVEYMNFFLKRNKVCNSSGRYETEDQAKTVDRALLDFLDDRMIDYTYVGVPDDQKAALIINLVPVVVK